MGRLIAVFHSPSKAMAELGERPSLAAFVVIVIVTALASVISLPYQLDFQVEVMERNAERLGLTPEQVADSTTLTNAKIVAAGLSGAAQGGATLLLGALVLNVMIGLSGAGGGYRRSLSVFSHAGLVGALGLVVKLPLMGAKRSIMVYTSPALLLQDPRPWEATTLILDRFDVFVLWQTVVLAIGLTAAIGVAQKRAVVLVGAFWLLVTLFTVALGVVGGRLGGLN